MDQIQLPTVKLEDQLRAMMLTNMNKPQDPPPQAAGLHQSQVPNSTSVCRPVQDAERGLRGGRVSGRGRGGHRGNLQQQPARSHVRPHLQKSNSGHQQPTIVANPRKLGPGHTQDNSVTPKAAPSRGLPYKPQQQGRGSKFTPLSRPQYPMGNMINVQCTYLQHLADQIVPQIKLRQDELEKKEEFRGQLEKICQELISSACDAALGSVELVAFGSLSSGFATTGSDMDLAFMSPQERPGFFRILEGELLKVGIGAHLLARTRVPIIKVCQAPSPQLLEALRAERQKWDDMTPEERDRYDSSGKAELETQAEPKEKPLTSADASATTESPKQDDQTRKAFEEHEHISNPAPQIHASSTESNEPQLQKPTAALDPAEGASQDRPVPQPADPETQGQEKADEAASATHTTDTPAASNSNHDSHPDATKEQPRANAPRQARPARVWYREKRLGPLDFPKDGVGVQCDINQANPLGLHNTHLLRCYNACDPRVQAMILFVKAWASARMINSSRNGTLSSYGYVLMVLHYLVNIADPAVCPNLQHSRRTGGLMPDARDPNALCQGSDVRFWRNEAEIRQLASRGFISHNKQPLGMLLRGFFMYFSEYNGFVWTQQVLSLRTLGSGILSKEQKGWTGVKTTMHEKVEVKNRYLFAIEDPFEVDHNVARTVTHNGIVAIRDEFRRAQRILYATGQGRNGVDDLLEPANLGQPALDS